MSKTKPGTTTQSREIDPSALLDQILEQQPSQRYRVVDAALSKRIDRLEELLPDSMKGQAARLVKRAMLTFSRNESLQECTPESFIRCVLQAAECGLAIDGKLAHAVPYNNKVKINGREEWRKEAQYQPDYKGLVAVAKRSGQIVDCYGDVVCERDQFAHGRSGPQSRLEHSYDHTAQDRGEVVAAYCIIMLPGGHWRYELMNVAELNKIQSRSKAGNKGPWQTDRDQMRIKTVIKRGLKLYCDDPGLIRAIELDDREFEGEPVQRTHKRVAISPLNQALQVPVAPKQSTFEPSTGTLPAQSHEADGPVLEREAGDESDESGPGFDATQYREGPDGELFPIHSEVGQ